MLNTEIRERYVTSKCEVFKLFSAIIIPSSIFNSYLIFIFSCIIFAFFFQGGYAGAQLVEVQCYKPEDCGLDSPWGH
jgi:hypothetical protein